MLRKEKQKKSFALTESRGLAGCWVNYAFALLALLG